MIYFKCKCGKMEFFGSGMMPNDCDGCTECGTTLATSPEGHKEIAPHEWIIKYDENTGKPYRRCKKCYQKEKEENDVVCNECSYCIDNDCDNSKSKRYGECVDGIVVNCNLFKDRS